MQVDRKFIWVVVVLVRVFRLAVNPTVGYFRSGEKTGLGTVLRPLTEFAKPGDPAYMCHGDDPLIAYYFRARFPQYPLIERDLGTGPCDYLDQVDRLVEDHPRTWLLMDHACGEVASLLDHLARRWEVDIIEERSPIRLYLVEQSSSAGG